MTGNTGTFNTLNIVSSITGSNATFDNILSNTSLTVTGFTGALTASNGIFTASVGSNNNNLRTFNNAVGWFRPFEPRREIILYDDFTGGTVAVPGDTGWTATVAGTAAAIANLAVGTQSDIGVISLSTGTTATGSALITKNATSFTYGLGVVVCEMRVLVATLSTTGVQQFIIRSGITSGGTTDPVNGVYFEYNLSAFGVNWQGRTSAASTRSVLNTGVAVTAGTYVTLRYEVNTAASLVTYYINDTNVGTLNTNIPTGSTQACTDNYSIVKSVGTTARTCQIDFWYRSLALTTQR